MGETLEAGAGLARALEQRCKLGPYCAHHQRLGLLVGVDAVLLEQFALVGEAIQQERDERHPFGAGHLGERLPELPRVFLAVVRWYLHPDQQDAGSGLAGGTHHRREVPAHGVHRLAAQAVVGAQFDDDCARTVLSQQGVEPVAPAQRGLAADAGVYHPVIQLFLDETLLQQIDPAAALRQSVAGGEAVAEHEQRRLLRERGRSRQC